MIPCVGRTTERRTCLDGPTSTRHRSLDAPGAGLSGRRPARQCWTAPAIIVRVMTWVAFLRGINVGGHRRVPMAELRAALTKIGLEDVRTHIVSGNVVFRTKRREAAALTRDIEHAIEQAFGFPVAVVLRTAAELRQLVDGDPLPDGSAADPAHRYAVFLSADPAPDRLAAINPAAVEPDVFVAGDRVIHAWYRGGLQGSKLAGRLTDRGLGVTATARNWNTVRTMADLADGGGVTGTDRTTSRKP